MLAEAETKIDDMVNGTFPEGVAAVSVVEASDRPHGDNAPATPTPPPDQAFRIVARFTHEEADRAIP